MAQDIQDQPPPKPNDARTPAWELVINYARDADDSQPQAVVDLVLADMHERDRVGRERYGVALTAHNGRKHLIDAYQESLDKAVYLRAELDERGIDPADPRDDLSGDDELLLCLFVDEVSDLFDLRSMIR